MMTRSVVRPLLILSTITAAIIAISAGGFLVATRVALLPGIDGCRLLREEEPARRECIALRTVALERDRGLVPALRAVEISARQHPRIRAVCHPAMHRAAATLHISTERGIHQLAAERGDCVAGFLHGIIENAVSRATNGDIASTVQLCSRPGATADAQSLQANCWHGLGHGLRRTYSTRRSLDQCQRIERDRTAPALCFGGVFMEDQFDRRRDIEVERDPIPPCRDVPDGPMSQACWGLVASRSLDFLRLSVPTTGAYCRSAPTRSDAEACLRYAGQLLPSARVRECVNIGPSSSIAECFDGHFEKFITTGELNEDRAARLCTSLPKPGATSCVDGFARYLSASAGATPARIEASCRDAFDKPALARRCTLRGVSERSTAAPATGEPDRA